ncbi:MAG: FtsQ-type POTRA domain-containing protein, partial [Eubacteriales bacterium]|nr:FtsQ-type POTRA domain-containing protein [Eubacteriales bacterium]
RRKIVFNILLFVLAIISSAYIIIYTEVFNIKEIQVSGNKQMSETEVVELSGLRLGDNLLRIDKKLSENRLMTGVLIKSAEIKRKLPNIIEVHVLERQEAVFMAGINQAFILDFEGIPLRAAEIGESNLPMIRLDSELNLRLGEMAYISGSDINVLSLIELLYYVKINGFDYVDYIDIREDGVYLTTTYGTLIKLDQSSNMKYQILFTKEIINDRIKNNQDVLGLLDFTKGENPVYIDFDDMEVKLEE